MNYFFELLQIAVGHRSELSGIPTEEEWETIMDLAAKQSLIAIAFAGLEKLPQQQWPSKQVLREWLGQSHVIDLRNKLTSEVCQSLCKQFEEDGFKVCVLKGQANHAYYPTSLANRRSCGDIDLWVVPENEKSKNASIKRVIEYCRDKYGLKGLCHLHANLPKIKDVPVEIHFYPSFMNEPIRNRRFQSFFDSIDRCLTIKDSEGYEIPAMAVEYDAIYQINHIYRHLIDEGVGLRQVLDYYFLLNSFYSSVVEKSDWQIAVHDTFHTIEWLGMRRFAGALMYVLKEVFGLEEEKMLCVPNERDGRFLLSEIMIAGNFGQSDPRMSDLANDGSRLRYQLSRTWRRIKRNLRFLTSYPGEVIFEPIARACHFSWKQVTVLRMSGQ